MIKNLGKMIVTQGVNYVSDWKDSNSNYSIEQYIPHGRYIINKVVTGCGFTTYSLMNNECTILVSPRLRLIQDKMRKMNKNAQNCFYFNREINPKTKRPLWDVNNLKDNFSAYYQQRVSTPNGILPLKILVTYDSFANLMDMLENDFHICANNIPNFRIVVDESHSIIKDVKMKEYNNKPVLIYFLDRLFRYDNILFVSATPIVQYLTGIPEFKNNEVGYYEMEWSNVEPMIQLPTHSCRNSLDAFDQIYDEWKDHTDINGNCVFDAIYTSPGHAIYSYEGVIFLNSVKDICRILKKYVGGGIINPSDINIICADTPDNATLLHKVNPMLTICKDIPDYGEPHKTWSFVTRTSFEGVDFMSVSASTYVIVNYNVKSLSLDIASDIPQIIGRQRRKDNPFRTSIHIYYTNNNRNLSLADFQQEQSDKRNESMKRIANWKTAQYQDTALEDIADKVEKYPNMFYLKTVNGKPEIDELIPISERYCFDILLNHQQWFVITGPGGNQRYSAEVEALKNYLPTIISAKINTDRIKAIHAFLVSNPHCFAETLFMLHNIGYNSIAYYFNVLPLDRITANSYDTSKIDNEIGWMQARQGSNTQNMVKSAFMPGHVYSKKEVKAILQGVYDANGIKRTAKSTDLDDLGVQYKTAKDVNGNKGIRIL